MLRAISCLGEACDTFLRSVVELPVRTTDYVSRTTLVFCYGKGRIWYLGIRIT